MASASASLSQGGESLGAVKSTSTPAASLRTGSPVSRTSATSQRSIQNRLTMWTASRSDSPALMSQSQDTVPDSKERKPGSSMKPSASLKRRSRPGSSLKMFQVCSAAVMGTISPKYSAVWPKSGTVSPTLNWMPNTSVFHNVADACSLSDVLETQKVPEKYWLTPLAATGILRRAEARGVALPEQLRAALLALSSKANPSQDHLEAIPETTAIQEAIPSSGARLPAEPARGPTPTGEESCPSESGPLPEDQKPLYYSHAWSQDRIYGDQGPSPAVVVGKREIFRTLNGHHPRNAPDDAYLGVPIAFNANQDSISRLDGTGAIDACAREAVLDSRGHPAGPTNLRPSSSSASQDDGSRHSEHGPSAAQAHAPRDGTTSGVPSFLDLPMWRNSQEPWGIHLDDEAIGPHRSQESRENLTKAERGALDGGSSAVAREREREASRTVTTGTGTAGRGAAVIAQTRPATEKPGTL